VGVLALKLFMAPAFVVGASLLTRRHGPRIGGVVGGLPVVAAPILIVLALVHGKGFGAQASSACLLGMVSLTAFAVAYARLAPVLPWAACLVIGWGVFGISTAVLAALTDRPGALEGLLVALASCGIGLLLMPGAVLEDADIDPPGWDLPMRGLAAGVMVLTITTLSGSLGSELSGLVAPFPIITSVLAAFTHAQRGAADTAVLLRGMLAGFCIYAVLVFAFALALGAPLTG
jgi:hypothetical protein